MDKKINSVLYIHDFRFIRDYQGNVYTAVGMPERYFDRFFDSGYKNVIILSRSITLSKDEIVKSGFTKIENKNIILLCDIKTYVSLFSPAFIKKLHNNVKQYELTVINFPSIIGTFFYFINFFYRKNYTIELAAGKEQFKGKRLGSLVSCLHGFIFPRIIRRSLGYITVSKYLASTYPHPNIEIASNVYIDKVQAPRSQLVKFSSKRKAKLLFVGGLNKRKGFDTLLDTMVLLKRNLGDFFELHVAGGHSDIDYELVSEKLCISDMVFFHGILDFSGLDALYRCSDIYVQPSLSEGIPRATLEAMSYGLPVVATELPGFKEILPSECLVPTSDPLSLFHKIKKISLKKKYI